MARTGTQAVLSAVTIWELRLKWHALSFSGVRKGPMDPTELLSPEDEPAVVALWHASGLR